MDLKEEELGKHGTTTVGIVCKSGLVLAAEKRATMGNLIAHRIVTKIVPITDRIAMTIAGLVGDAQAIERFLKAQMRIYEFKYGKKATVKSCAAFLSNILFSNRMSPWPFYVQLLLGGFDETGVHLYTLVADGSVIEDKYISTGSGSVIAYGVLEDQFKEGMDLDEGISIAYRGVSAAMKRDVNSGDGIDVFTITNTGIKRLSQDEVQKTISK